MPSSAIAILLVFLNLCCVNGLRFARLTGALAAVMLFLRQIEKRPHSGCAKLYHTETRPRSAKIPPP